MPELPDVEVFKQYLDATALHRRIAGISVSCPRLLQGTSAAGLGRRLKGKTFRSSRRHGKHLLIEVPGEPWLALHFGMTGFLRYFKDPAEAPGHVCVAVDFRNGYRLAYVSQRKLGRVGFADSVEALVEAEGLGPDALSVSLGGFRAILAKARGMLKTTLMNQAALAGIGNVYSDEILFQAGIHPKRPAETLDAHATGELYRCLRRVLRKAIRCQADPGRLPGSYLLPQRRDGGRCPRCGGPLRRITIAGRGTYSCPREQRAGPGRA